MIQSEVGFAGDLFQPSMKFMALTGGVSGPSEKVLITLSDLLLLHDKVFLRADAVTLRELFGAVTIDDLQTLTENNRVGFYKPYFYRGGIFPDYENDFARYLNQLKNTFYEEDFNVSRAEKIITDNVLPAKTPETFEEFKKTMYDLFYNNELLKDKDVHMNNQIGFEEGVSRIRELWHSGITSINYDWEFHLYLDICDKAAFFKQKELNVSVKNPEHSIVDDLHKFKNIPSIAEMLVKTDKPIKLFQEIINSHEADDFRKWIRKLEIENIDVRDAYERDTHLLPSKNKWIDWLRFGSVSVISSILGTIVTSNPYLGFLIGTGVSTVDKVYGEKAIDVSTNKYNPNSWISFIEPKN